MNQLISVSLGPAIDEQERPSFILKIQRDDWEINIWMTANELAVVPNVRLARWDERESIQLGRSAGSPTFWSCEDGNLSILVGQDAECWDFGLTLPEEILDDVIAEIERETKPSE
jgi:hypothetical protein